MRGGFGGAGVGDRIYLGNPWPQDLTDGAGSLYLAGASGNAFSRVLVDSSGERHVPHYRAVDMASDNRIAPGGRALSTHRFELPEGCGPGRITARVLYRPIPLAMATLRGWEARDYVISSAEQTFP